MEALVPIGIWLVLGIVGLGLLAMVGFGARSMAYGKIKPLTIAFVVSPFLLIVVMGFAIGDWTKAAMLSLFVIIGVALLAMVASSFRSLFS